MVLINGCSPSDQSIFQGAFNLVVEVIEVKEVEVEVVFLQYVYGTTKCTLDTGETTNFQAQYHNLLKLNTLQS